MGRIKSTSISSLLTMENCKNKQQNPITNLTFILTKLKVLRTSWRITYLDLATQWIIKLMGTFDIKVPIIEISTYMHSSGQVQFHDCMLQRISWLLFHIEKAVYYTFDL